MEKSEIISGMFNVSNTSTSKEVKTDTVRKIYYPMKTFGKIKVKHHTISISAQDMRRVGHVDISQDCIIIDYNSC
jgi:hypothetical protein